VSGCFVTITKLIDLHYYSGWVSGKAHSYKATLAHNGKTVKHYEGTWTGVGKVAKSEEVFTDSTVPKTEVSVKPIEEQGEWESWGFRRRFSRQEQTRGESFRQLAIVSCANRLRPTVQNDQRQRRKDEAAAGTTWPLKYFQYVERDPVYHALAKSVKGAASDEEAYIVVRS
jgi:hypothetical protein